MAKKIKSTLNDTAIYEHKYKFYCHLKTQCFFSSYYNLNSVNVISPAGPEIKQYIHRDWLTEDKQYSYTNCLALNLKSPNLKLP